MDKLPALEDLRVFVISARNLSFKKAADQLCVSPAYVSKRIRILESNLGLTLFFRTARAVSLTQEGRIVLQRSELMLEQFSQMQSELQSVRNEAWGEIRISCSTGFGSEYLNPFVLWLRERHPLLGIDLVLQDRAVDIVAENVDLDICLGGTISPHYIARRIASNYRVFCAAPTYIERHGMPSEPQSLGAGHRCIAIRERNHNHASWRVESDGQVATVIPNGQLTVNNGNVAKQWCINGEGIMLRSIWNVRDELTQGRLIRVLPEWWQNADVYAVYSRKKETSANLKILIENLEKYLQQRLIQSRGR